MEMYCPMILYTLSFLLCDFMSSLDFWVPKERSGVVVVQNNLHWQSLSCTLTSGSMVHDWKIFVRECHVCMQLRWILCLHVHNWDAICLSRIIVMVANEPFMRSFAQTLFMVRCADGHFEGARLSWFPLVVYRSVVQSQFQQLFPRKMCHSDDYHNAFFEAHHTLWHATDTNLFNSLFWISIFALSTVGD